MLLGFCSTAQEGTDSAEVPIDVLIMIEGMETVYSPCDSIPTFFLYEDGNLIFSKKLDSLNQTIGIRSDEFNLIRPNHNYRIKFSQYPPVGTSTSNDDFTTHGISNPTRIIRSVKFGPGCLNHRERSFFYFEDDSLIDHCDFKWILRDINVRDSAKLEIQYYGPRNSDNFKIREEYLKRTLTEIGYRNDQFWFTMHQSEDEREYLQVMIYSM